LVLQNAFDQVATFATITSFYVLGEQLVPIQMSGHSSADVFPGFLLGHFYSIRWAPEIPCGVPGP
jgi:hypothetical protein